MNLAEIQRSKLKDILYVEADNAGITLNPFDITDFLDAFYSSPSQTPGMPTVAPTIQEPRELFNVTAYNSFLSSIELDTDVLSSMFKRSRLDSRNVLMYNDVELRRLITVLTSVSAEVDEFFATASEISEDDYKTTTKRVNFSTAQFKATPDTDELFVDAGAGTVSLHPLPTKSTSVDMRFLSDLSDAVTVVAANSAILTVEEPAPLSVLSVDDPTPWLYTATLSNPSSEVSLILTIPLPSLTEVNNITINPIPGSAYKVTVDTSANTDNWQQVGHIPSMDRKETIHFKPRTIQAIRITLSITKETDTSNTEEGASFLFGLTSIAISRTEYASQGSITVKDIDPKIGDRPILSVTMEAEDNLPKGTQANYFMGLNVYSNVPSLKIAGTKEGNNKVVFSVASELTEPRATLVRTTAFELTRNSIDYSSLKFGSLAPLDIRTSTYIPKLSKVWLGQNAFKVDDYPEFEVKNIRDCIVNFTAVNTPVEIHAPLTITGLSLQQDPTGNYLSLPLAVAYPAVFSNEPVTNELDVLTLMKTVDAGVFRIQSYPSDNPVDPTVKNQFIDSISSDGKKIYLVGATPPNTLFSIDYLAVIDGSVSINRGKFSMHDGIGAAGADSSNYIPRSSGRYSISFTTNKLFTTDATMVGKRYVDIQGVFDTSKLKVYESWMYVDKYQLSIPLDRTVSVDTDAGEFISIDHKRTSTNVDINNKDKITELKEGWHFITVVSKALSAQPSAIKTLLSVKDQQGILGVTDSEIFSLTKSKYISKLGITNEPYKYVDKEIMFNESKIHNNYTYSSLVVGNNLVFIAPTFKGGIQYADSVSSSGDVITGQEYSSIQITSFANNLFKDDIHSRINIRIDLANTADTSSTLVTPTVSALNLTFKYL